MKPYGIIYKITNLLNNKVYIGLTIGTLRKRWNKHITSSGCAYLHNAILKYGKENFNQEIIDTALSLEELNSKEIYWISFYKANIKHYGYNILIGGNNGRLGIYKLTLEEINKIKELDELKISHIEIAKMFNIERKTVTNILRRHFLYKSKRIKLKDRTDLEEIKAYLLNNNPTAKEVREKFNIGQNSLFAFAKSIGFHFMKASDRKKEYNFPKSAQHLVKDENVLRT